MSRGEARGTSAPLLRARIVVHALVALVILVGSGITTLSKGVLVGLIMAALVAPLLHRNPAERVTVAVGADIAAAWFVWSLTAEPVLPLVIVMGGMVLAAFEPDLKIGRALVIAAAAGELVKAPAVALGLGSHQILTELVGFADFSELLIQATLRATLVVAAYGALRMIRTAHATEFEVLAGTAVDSRGLIERAPAPLLVLDGWTIRSANDAASDLLGMPENDTDFRDHLGEAEVARLDPMLAGHDETPTLVEEVVLTPANGDLRIMDVTLRYVPTGDGGFHQLALMDVTRRAGEHLELSEREEVFSGAFIDSATPSGIATLEGTIVQVNRAFTELLGYPPEDVIGRSWENFTVRAEWPKAFNRRDSEGEVPRQETSTEAQFQTKDGRLVPLLVSNATVRNHRGEPFRVLTQLIDLSARVFAEEQVERRISQQQIVAQLGELALQSDVDSLLVEAAEALSQHLDSFATGIFTAEPDGTLVLAAGVGWPDGAVGDHSVPSRSREQMDFVATRRDPVIVESLDLERRFEAPQMLLQRGARASVGCQIRSSRAILGAVAAWSSRERSYTEDDVHFIEAVANLLAAAIEQQAVMDRLEVLVASKDQFLASVSHELRTPLTVVNGMAAELHENWSNFSHEEVAEFVRLITDQSRDMAALIEDLLVAARADIGAVTIRAVPVDLRRELQAVLRALPDIELAKNEVRHLPVMGDATRLRQILRNLLTNAHRYGGPVIRAASSFDGEYVQVSIADNGNGIPADLHAKIFEPYERAHIRAGVTGSVGLGLSVSRTLAELMGGTLSYRYADGESVFDLTLPAASTPAVANVVPLDERRAIS